MPLSRRQLLLTSALLGSSAAVPSLALAAGGPESGERRLCLRNLHTEESLKLTYWENGCYVAENLEAINHLLRDHRSNQSTTMDVTLIDSLYRLGRLIGSNEINIISGYRSPDSNELLRRQSSGVAKNSFHLHGRALDVQFTGVSLRNSLKAALKHHRGGVGYYPRKSYGFIHLDTGNKRQWGPI